MRSDPWLWGGAPGLCRNAPCDAPTRSPPWARMMLECSRRDFLGEAKLSLSVMGSMSKVPSDPCGCSGRQLHHGIPRRTLPSIQAWGERTRGGGSGSGLSPLWNDGIGCGIGRMRTGMNSLQEGGGNARGMVARIWLSPDSWEQPAPHTPNYPAGRLPALGSH